MPTLYVQILRSTFTLPYRIWWDNVPPPPPPPPPGSRWAGPCSGCCCARSRGFLLLRCFELYLPRGAVAGLSLALGMGLAGVVFELLAMAHPSQPMAGGDHLAGDACRTVRGRARLPHGAAAMRSALPSRRGIAGWSKAIAAPRMDPRHDTTLSPLPGLPRVAYMLALLLITAIALLVTLQAIALCRNLLGFADPLRRSHARRIFEQHSFPYKVVGQVGIGLRRQLPPPLLAACRADRRARRGNGMTCMRR